MTSHLLDLLLSSKSNDSSRIVNLGKLLKKKETNDKNKIPNYMINSGKVQHSIYASITRKRCR
jgi:hypothetical protein